jgi:hypothetical protein
VSTITEEMAGVASARWLAIGPSTITQAIAINAKSIFCTLYSSSERARCAVQLKQPLSEVIVPSWRAINEILFKGTQLYLLATRIIDPHIE